MVYIYIIILYLKTFFNDMYRKIFCKSDFIWQINKIEMYLCEYKYLNCLN